MIIIQTRKWVEKQKHETSGRKRKKKRNKGKKITVMESLEGELN